MGYKLYNTKDLELLGLDDYLHEYTLQSKLFTDDKIESFDFDDIVETYEQIDIKSLSSKSIDLTEKYIDEYNTSDNFKVFEVEEFDTRIFNKDTKYIVELHRKKFVKKRINEFNTENKNLDQFTIFYAGMLDESRNLNIENLIKAIVELEGVSLIIAGKGDLVPQIYMYTQKYPNKMQYLGWIDYEEVLKFNASSHLLFSLRVQQDH